MRFYSLDSYEQVVKFWRGNMREILEQHKQLLLDYLQAQVKMEKWHEAISAIIQLEVIGAQLDLLSDLNID